MFLETLWAEEADESALEISELRQRIEPLRHRILVARSKRIYPLLDDKVLTAWNGLMIEAYARGFEVLGQFEYRQVAERAADFVLDNLRREDGSLWRVHRLGASRHAGFLDDYAYFVRGLTVLHRATGEQRWLQAARELSDEMVARFWDGEAGWALFCRGRQRTDHAQQERPGFGSALGQCSGGARAVGFGRVHWRGAIPQSGGADPAYFWWWDAGTSLGFGAFSGSGRALFALGGAKRAAIAIGT